MKLVSGLVDVQSPRNPVIPVQAGIQSKDVDLVFLDSRLRREDGKFYISLPILHFAVLLTVPPVHLQVYFFIRASVVFFLARSVHFLPFP